MTRALRCCTACMLLAAAIAGGCASTQSDEVMTRVQALTSEGHWEGAIETLESAAREVTPNHSLRAALSGTRERAVLTLLREAEGFRQAGRHADASATYERVLRLQPAEIRASAGLQQILADQRHAALLDEAGEALKKGNVAAAEAPVKKVLIESPRNTRALALQRRIDERRPRLAAPALSVSLRKPITLEFRDANLKMVFDVISRASGVNFILDKDIRADAKATILVKNAPIEDAIESLLTTNQLAKKVLNENSVLVYPLTPQKVKDYQDLVIRNFFLASADAKQMMTLLRTILKTRDVYLDERRNLLVVRDTPEAIQLAERLIAAHDQVEPEVMLEMEVLEVSRTKINELGIAFATQVGFGAVSPITLLALRSLDSSGVNVSGLDKAATLNLQRVLTDANVLANPRIRVRNKEKAKIHVGDRVPVVSTVFSGTTAFASQNVSYLEVGLKLEVEPQVLDDDVVIKVSLEVSSIAKEIPGQNGTVLYQVGTRTASTTLTLKDGETQVLAGLITDNDRENTQRLPGLGDLPLLGRLFSSNRNTSEKTEIILSVTPRIVRRLERPDASLAEFWSGPETNLRSAIAPGAPFGIVPAPPAVPRPPTAPGLQPSTGGAGFTQPQGGGIPGVVTTFGATPGAVPLPTPQPSGTGTPVSPAVAPAAPSEGSAPPGSAPATSSPPFYFQPPPGVGSR